MFDARGAPGWAGWSVTWGVAAERAAGTLGIVVARLAIPGTIGPTAAAEAIPGPPLIPSAVPTGFAAGEGASIGVPGAGNGPVGEPVALGPGAAAQDPDLTTAGSTGSGGALSDVAAQDPDWTTAESTGLGGTLPDAAATGMAATVVGRAEPTSGLAATGVGIAEVTSGLDATPPMA